MFRRAILGFLSLSAATVVAAQRTTSGSSLAGCTEIGDAGRRLACYDSVAGRQTTRVHITLGGAGRWTVTDTTNPLNDVREVILALRASSGQSSYGRPVILILRCRDEKAEIYVDWGSYISDEGGQVTMRVGEANAETAQWSISNDNRATFYPEDAQQLIQRLTASSRLVVQTTPYEENPITAVFDLAGLSKAVQPLAAACKW